MAGASRKELLQAAISHEKKFLSESVDVTDFLPHLLQEHVIEPVQEQEIQARLGNKGNIHAADLLWSMVLKDEISAVRFVDVMQKQGHFICDTLEGFVAKVESGEWSLHGEPDIPGGFQ